MVANLAQDQQEILDFYNAGVEKERLVTGIGKVEFERTKEIISRYLRSEKQVIYDVGGGTGFYSRWLADLGYEVHLLELAPRAVEYARQLNQGLEHPISCIEVADALDIQKPDASADIVLLMGPLYHLTQREDRIKALCEARRVLKKGGLLIASAISRYGSTLWGLSVYGQKNDFLDDDVFLRMIQRELKDGQHIRPVEYPFLLTRAFFHLPSELANEVEDAGLIREKVIAVEGPVWIVPAFEEKWADENSRERLLRVSRTVEAHENIMGMSPHLLAIARNKGDAGT